jgi:putative oxidoreductase
MSTFRRAFEKVDRNLVALAPVTELLVRVAAGVFLVYHGYPKLLGHTTATAGFFEQQGFRPGLLWAVAVGLTEFAGGLCLAAGLFTRIVCVPILVFLATAVAYHWPRGVNWIEGGFEYPLLWALVVLHFLVRGSGPYSVDALLVRRCRQR